MTTLNLDGELFTGEVIDTYGGSTTYRDVYYIDGPGYGVQFLEYTYGAKGTDDFEEVYDQDDIDYLYNLYLPRRNLGYWFNKLEQQVEKILWDNEKTKPKGYDNFSRARFFTTETKIYPYNPNS